MPNPASRRSRTLLPFSVAFAVLGGLAACKDSQPASKSEATATPAEVAAEAAKHQAVVEAAKEAPTAKRRPVVAVAPFVGVDGQPGWIGSLFGDHITRRLLVRAPINEKTKKADHPVDVFSWRQTASAARSAGITPAEATARASELLDELGADVLLTGTYTVDGDRLAVDWQLVDADGPKAKKTTGAPSEASKMAYAIGASVLTALGQSGEKDGAPASLPPEGAKSWGEALVILAKQSQDPRAHVVLDKVERAKAVAALEAVTSAVPTFAPAWASLAIVASMSYDEDTAEKALANAMSHAQEGEPAPAIARYYVYERQSLQDEARNSLEKAVYTYPGSLQALGYLGDAYYGVGEFQESLSVFSTYLDRVPASPFAARRRDAILSRLGRHDEAIANAQALAVKYPKSVTILAALASRQIDAGKMAAARQTLKAGLERRPNHPLLLTRLSYVELESGSATKALELAQKAVELIGDGRGEPLAGYAHIDLARALAVAGRKEEAKARLIKAVRLGVDGDDIYRLATDPRLEGFIEFPIVLPPQE